MRPSNILSLSDIDGGMFGRSITVDTPNVAKGGLDWPYSGVKSGYASYLSWPFQRLAAGYWEDAVVVQSNSDRALPLPGEPNISGSSKCLLC